VPLRHLDVRGEPEPEEAVRRQREEVRQLADRREGGAPGHLDRHPAAKAPQVELHRLRGARQVRHAQDRLAVELAQIGEHLAVARLEERQPAAPEHLARAAHR
jgi:hypothetical protein